MTKGVEHPTFQPLLLINLSIHLKICCMRNDQIFQEAPDGYEYVFTPYVTRNGKRIYRRNGGYFRFLKKNI